MSRRRTTSLIAAGVASVAIGPSGLFCFDFWSTGKSALPRL